METEIKTKTSLKLTFVPTHQTSTGIVIGELQTEGGWTICSIEKTNAEEIIKRNNMHDELIEKLKNLASSARANNDYDCDRGLQEAVEDAENLLLQAEQK